MNGEALNVTGHPSCPGRFRRDADRTVFPPETVVMLPPVTPDLRPVLDTLLTRIRNRQDIELSVNDWGTLSVFADMKKRGELACMLTAGVLLAGQDTDPVLLRLTRRQPDRIILDGNENCLLSWNPPSQALLRHWSTPSVFTMKDVLMDWGVSRLELCAQPFPFPEETPFLPVRYICPAILSVIPCTGNCGHCAGMASCFRERYGIRLRVSANLVLADLPLPETGIPSVDLTALESFRES